MPQLPTYVAHVVRVGADCAFDEKKYYTEFRISSTVKRSRYRTFNSIRLGEGKSFADGGAGPLATFSSRLNSHVLTLASYDTSDTSTPPHRPYTLTACPAALFADTAMRALHHARQAQYSCMFSDVAEKRDRPPPRSSCSVAPRPFEPVHITTMS